MGLFYLCCGSGSKSVKKNKHRKSGKHADNDKSNHSQPNHKNCSQRIDFTAKDQDFQVNLQSLQINLPDVQLPTPEFSVIDESELLLQKKRGIDLYPTKDQTLRAQTENIIQTEPCKSVSTNNSSVEIISNVLLEKGHIDCGEITELEKEEVAQIESFETVKENHNFSDNSSNRNSSLEDVSSLILEDIVHDLSTANSCENIEPDQENLDFQVNINCRKSALSTLREESTSEIISDNTQSEHNNSKTISEDLRSICDESVCDKSVDDKSVDDKPVGDKSVEMTSWELMAHNDLLVESDLEATRETLNCSTRTEDFFEVPTIEDELSTNGEDREEKYSLKTKRSREDENISEGISEDVIQKVKIDDENSMMKLRTVPETVSTTTTSNAVEIAYRAEIPQFLLETYKQASLKTLDTTCSNEKIVSSPVTEDVFKPVVEPSSQLAEPKIQFVSLTRKYENEMRNEIIEDRTYSVEDFVEDFEGEVEGSFVKKEGFEIVGLTNHDLQDTDLSSDYEPSETRLINSTETSHIEEKTSVLQTCYPSTRVTQNSAETKNPQTEDDGTSETLTSETHEVLNERNKYVNMEIEDSNQIITGNTIPTRETVDPVELQNENSIPTDQIQKNNTDLNANPENSHPKNVNQKEAIVEISSAAVENFTAPPEPRTSRHHLFHSVGNQSDFQAKPVQSLKLTKKKPNKRTKRLKRIAVTTLVCLVPISSLYLWSNSVEITG